MTLVSFPIPTRPGDLPNLDDATLLAQGYISGFRAVRMNDGPAAVALAETNIRGAHGFRCHASVQTEIDALTAAESANASAQATALTARQAALQARCDVDKTHA